MDVDRFIQSIFSGLGMRILLSMFSIVSMASALVLPAPQSFRTVDVSLSKALRIMHTPEFAGEYLGLAYPGFRLCRTRPMNNNTGTGYSVLSFEYKTNWNQPALGCMLSREPQSVHYMTLDQFRNPTRFLTLSLLQSPSMKFAIGVDGTWLREPTELEMLMYQIKPDLTDVAISNDPAKWISHPDPNIRKWHTKFLTSAVTIWGGNMDV